MFMDDMKLFSKNEKELETQIQALRIYSHPIGKKFGREKMGHANNEMKRKKNE